MADQIALNFNTSNYWPYLSLGDVRTIDASRPPKKNLNPSDVHPTLNNGQANKPVKNRSIQTPSKNDSKILKARMFFKERFDALGDKLAKIKNDAALFLSITKDNAYKGYVYDTKIIEIRPVFQRNFWEYSCGKIRFLDLIRNMKKSEGNYFLTDDEALNLDREIKFYSEYLDKNGENLNIAQSDFDLIADFIKNLTPSPQNSAEVQYLMLKIKSDLLLIMINSLKNEELNSQANISEIYLMLQFLVHNEYMSTNPDDFLCPIEDADLSGHDSSDFFNFVSLRLARDFIYESWESLEIDENSKNGLIEIINAKLAEFPPGFVSRYYLFLKRFEKNFWNETSFNNSVDYFSALKDGPIRPINIENIDAVIYAKNLLSPNVEFFSESGKAHDAPPDILAALALQNLFYKKYWPTYDLKSAFDVVAFEYDEEIFGSSVFHRLYPYLENSKIADISFQDRVVDFGAALLGASPTIGLMQIRAGHTMTFEHNVKENHLFKRFDASASGWSNRKINYYLLTKDAWNIEASAALWELMMNESIEKQIKGEIALGLPPLKDFAKSNWLNDNFDAPLSQVYGPDFICSLLPYRSYGSPFNSGLYGNYFWFPHDYMINALLSPGREVKINTLHIIALETGLFDEKPIKAIIVGISSLSDLDKLETLTKSQDKYLSEAAIYSLQELSRCDVAEIREKSERILVDI